MATGVVVMETVANLDRLVKPAEVEFRPSEVELRKPGVWCVTPIKEGRMYGPYAGEVVTKDKYGDINYRYAWEVFNFETNRVQHIINATNPVFGNWMRYVNCARYFEEQNIVSVQVDEEVYYKAIKDIEVGEELLTWFDLEQRQNVNVEKKDKKKKQNETKPKVSKKKVEVSDDESETASPKKKTQPCINASLLTKSSPQKRKVTSPVQTLGTVEVKKKKKEIQTTMNYKINKKSSNKWMSLDKWPTTETSTTTNKSPKSIKSPSMTSKSPLINKSSTNKWLTSTTQLPVQNNSLNINKSSTISKSPVKIASAGSAKSPGSTKSVSSAKSSPKQLQIGKSSPSSSKSPGGMKSPNSSRSPNKVKSMRKKTEKVDNDKTDLKMKSGSPNSLLKTENSSNYFEFHVGKKHHVIRDRDGKKMYECELCDVTYLKPFSLKRHFLRTHINCQYVSSRDLINCCINASQQMERIESAQKTQNSGAKLYNGLIRSQNSSPIKNSQSKNYSPGKLSTGETTPFKKSGNSVNNEVRFPGLYKCDSCYFVFDDMNQLISHNKCHDSANANSRDTSPNKTPNSKLPARSATKRSSKKMSIKDATQAQILPMMSKATEKSSPSKSTPSKLSKGSPKKTLRKSSGDISPRKKSPVKNSSPDLPQKKSPMKNSPTVFSSPKKKFYARSPRSSPRLSGSPFGKRRSPKKKPRGGKYVKQKFKNYPCTLCKVRFTKVSNLEKHLKEHNENKAFPCYVCGKAFMNETKMKQHVRYHFGQNVSCRHCSDKFANVGDMRIHLKNTHKEEWLLKEKEENKTQAKTKKANQQNIGQRSRKDKVKVISEKDYRAFIPDKKLVQPSIKNSLSASPKKIFKFLTSPVSKKKVSENERAANGYKSKYRYSCFTCKKRFISYFSLGQHRKTNHRYDRYSAPSVLLHMKQKVSEEKNPIGVLPMLAPPVSPDPYYETVTDNVSTNLESFLDGKAEALRNYKKHIQINGYRSINSVTHFKTPKFDWTNYNFPFHYQPYESVIGYSASNKGPMIPEDVTPAHDLRRETAVENSFLRSGIRHRPEALKELKLDVSSDEPPVLQCMSVSEKSQDSDGDSDNNSMPSLTPSYDEEKGNKFFHKFDGEPNVINKSSVESSNLTKVDGASQNSLESSENKSSALHSDNSDSDDINLTTCVPHLEALNLVNSSEREEIINQLEAANQAIPARIFEKDLRNTLEGQKWESFRDEIAFGKLGDVINVCSVCKRYFESVDSLVRHQYTKHSSMKCRYLQIEKGNGIDGLFYSWPSNEGMLASSTPIPEDCHSLSLYRCTRCKSSFKNISRLHVHIISCDPKKLFYVERISLKERRKQEEKEKKKEARLKAKEEEAKQRGRKKKNHLSRAKAQLEQKRKNEKVKKIIKERQAGKSPSKSPKVIQKATRSPDNKFGLSPRSLREARRSQMDLSSMAGDGRLTRQRKRRNYELLYKPDNHVRRREMADVIETHQCSGCNLKFRTLFLLERHARKCSEKDKLRSSKSIKDSKQPNSVTLQHNCQYCTRKFTYLKSLANHYKDFCHVKKDRQKNGEINKEELEKEKVLREEITGLEGLGNMEDKITEEMEGNKKRCGWPRGMKRKNRRKNHSWTYTKKKKSSQEDDPLVEEEDKKFDFAEDLPKDSKGLSESTPRTSSENQGTTCINSNPHTKLERDSDSGTLEDDLQGKEKSGIGKRLNEIQSKDKVPNIQRSFQDTEKDDLCSSLEAQHMRHTAELVKETTQVHHLSRCPSKDAVKDLENTSKREQIPNKDEQTKDLELTVKDKNDNQRDEGKWNSVQSTTANGLENVEATTSKGFGNVEATTPKGFDNVEVTTSNGLENVEVTVSKVFGKIEESTASKGLEKEATAYKELENTEEATNSKGLEKVEEVTTAKGLDESIQDDVKNLADTVSKTVIHEVYEEVVNENKQDTDISKIVVDGNNSTDLSLSMQMTEQLDCAVEHIPHLLKTANDRPEGTATSINGREPTKPSSAWSNRADLANGPIDEIPEAAKTMDVERGIHKPKNTDVGIIAEAETRNLSSKSNLNTIYAPSDHLAIVHISSAGDSLTNIAAGTRLPSEPNHVKISSMSPYKDNLDVNHKTTNSPSRKKSKTLFVDTLIFKTTNKQLVSIDNTKSKYSETNGNVHYSDVTDNIKNDFIATSNKCVLDEIVSDKNQSAEYVASVTAEQKVDVDREKLNYDANDSDSDTTIYGDDSDNESAMYNIDTETDTDNVIYNAETETDGEVVKPVGENLESKVLCKENFFNMGSFSKETSKDNTVSTEENNRANINHPSTVTSGDHSNSCYTTIVDVTPDSDVSR
ncbi:uncharacterized protein LOC126828844 [Patella vulgata]|uniref:uncharacterized protein LOC126828844 n=1 Tax=Patella vulgata TaxID=6465 RepID=UPI00217F8077|nr:uncharacterized protein LOC126828844 [Patella vulgata]